MTDDGKEQERKNAERLYLFRRLLGQDIDPDVVDQRRKAAIAHRETMLGFQKEAGQMRLPEYARFFKGEANEALKEYRGACLVLGYLLCDPPKDSLPKNPEDWPFEILPYVERACHEPPKIPTQT